MLPEVQKDLFKDITDEEVLKRAVNKSVNFNLLDKVFDSETSLSIGSNFLLFP